MKHSLPKNTAAPCVLVAKAPQKFPVSNRREMLSKVLIGERRKKGERCAPVSCWVPEVPTHTYAASQLSGACVMPEEAQLLFDASASNNGCLQLRNVIPTVHIYF